MSGRTVVRLHRATRDDVGDLHTWRPLPSREIEQIDPFLFLNHHGPQVYPPGNRGLPFGPHPHRGFETVTFILAGSLAHRDSGGHESVIDAGGVQWMTAGRGLEHSELSPASFLESGGALEILQLWVNLPARLKMTEPRYVGLQAGAIPAIEEGGLTVHLVSGDWKGIPGPVAPLAGVTMTWIDLAPAAAATLDVPEGHNVFFYIVRGEVTAGETIVPQMHLAEFDSSGGAIAIRASVPSLLLFGHAQPFGEPVFSYGPFVMNTREEIVKAIEDYQAGRFGRA